MYTVVIDNGSFDYEANIILLMIFAWTIGYNNSRLLSVLLLFLFDKMKINNCSCDEKSPTNGLHGTNFLKNFGDGYQFAGENSQLILWKVTLHIFFYRNVK